MGALLADVVLVPARGAAKGLPGARGGDPGRGGGDDRERRGPAAPGPAAVALAVLLAATLAAPRFRPWDRTLMTAGVYQYGLEWKDRPGFRLQDLGRERRLSSTRKGARPWWRSSERRAPAAASSP